MRKMKIVAMAISFAIVMIAANPPEKITIFCTGDSTMANKDTTGGKLERGWGMYLHEFFNDNVQIKNLAQNGRSTRTFQVEGWWDKAIDELQKGDYVIIQFGHNDDVESKKSFTTPGEYQNNLRLMIDEVRCKGGIPILCTPVVRRKFDKKGRLMETHKYPSLVRKVAKERDVLFVDMLTLTKEWLAPLGDGPSKRFFMNFPMGKYVQYPKGSNDDTHFVEAGARHVAGLFVDALTQSNDMGSDMIMGLKMSVAQPEVIH